MRNIKKRKNRKTNHAFTKDNGKFSDKPQRYKGTPIR